MKSVTILAVPAIVGILTAIAGLDRLQSKPVPQNSILYHKREPAFKGSLAANDEDHSLRVPLQGGVPYMQPKIPGKLRAALLLLFLSGSLLAQGPVRGIKKPICIFADDSSGLLVFNRKNGKYNLLIHDAQVNVTSQATLIRDGCAWFLRDDNPAYLVLVSFDDCSKVAAVTLLIKPTGVVHSFTDYGANILPCAES